MTKNIKHKAYLDALVWGYQIIMLQRIFRHSVYIHKHFKPALLVWYHARFP